MHVTVDAFDQARGEGSKNVREDQPDCGAKLWLARESARKGAPAS
jgi:hypothetical protein